MRVLITGVAGFVGHHLVAELAAHGHESSGLDRAVATDLPVREFIAADMCDGAAIHDAVVRLAPDACVHLAGMAFVPSGQAYPAQMAAVNIMGTTHLLEALRSAAPRARLLCISTAQVYGATGGPTPLREEDPLRPDSLYAVTKAASDGIALLYARQYGMPIMIARPHNHIGPGQSSAYVVASFASQVAAIRRGAPPLIKVGNLDSQRDFTDVRDVVRAYRLLIERGTPGEIYNIASGRQVRIGEVLSRLCELARIRPEIVRDNALYRPSDGGLILDTSRLRTTTGWAPTIPLDQTLHDLMELA